LGAPPIHVNVGGAGFVDSSGVAWIGDMNFNTGSPKSTSAPVGNTPDPRIYQSERWDSPASSELMYTFLLNPGTYLVRLHFAEMHGDVRSAGERVFDVFIEGNLVLDDFDIFAAVGAGMAAVQIAVVTVTDGALNIEFVHGVGNPTISGIEVLDSVAALESDVSVLDWGDFSVGTSGEVKNVTLTNEGNIDLAISGAAFNVNDGSGGGFEATIGGSAYAGDAVSIAHPVNIDVPVGQSIVVPVQFSAEDYGDHDVDLVFSGNFDPVSIELSGAGHHPFLHALIVADPYTVDADEDGSEPVSLVGSFSFTDEPGHSLTAFEWSENGNIFSTLDDVITSFNVGTHTVTLRIEDDNSPPMELSASQTFDVVPPTAVPGAIALYYPAGGAGGANAFLDTPPADASFVEILSSGLQITSKSATIGGSPYSSFVMVRVLATIEVDTAGQYEFFATGGNERRLFLDGAPLIGPVALTGGSYELDLRFAVNAIGEMPLNVTYSINAGAPMPIGEHMLSHDETGMHPVINSMPTYGLNGGGEATTIAGLGFLPLGDVVVHWGSLDLSGADLIVKRNEIYLTTPPGTGPVEVRVETPNGISNTVIYTYHAEGSVPVMFEFTDLASGLGALTAGAMGPDGRLYVSENDGTIHAVTIGLDYEVTDVQTITALEGLSNSNILGMTTSPFEAPGVVKLYVAHSQLLANSGDCFADVSPYSGQITCLTGPDFNVPQTVISGLPVSNYVHGISGITFDDNGNLLFSVGSNTNAGIAACAMGGLNESPLSAAILRANVFRADFYGEVIHIDPATCLIDGDQTYGGSMRIAHGVDVDMFAAGFRNAQGLVFTTRGRVYATDDGAMQGLGDSSTGPNSQTVMSANVEGELNHIDIGRYFGSPNRNRGHTDERQDVYRDPSETTVAGDFEAPIATFNALLNDVIEFRSNVFDGAVRGELVAAQMNGPTSRISLSEEGTSTTAIGTLFTHSNAVGLVEAPGGVVLGIDGTNGKVTKAIPNDIAATELKVYDILPWRAPALGGHSFVIGGSNFGDLGNTSVTIDGNSAALSVVSSSRILGTIPAGAAGPNLLDVVVTVDGESETLTKAFRYLRAPAMDSGAQAHFFVNPGGSILEASTYGGGAFNLVNESTGGQNIVRLRLDSSTAIVPDSTFDPYGIAGDPVGKDFTFNGGQMDVTSYTWFNPHDDGFDTLEVTFDDFTPGKTMLFSADMDPTSIRGAAQPGPNDSGSISGLELTGARVRVEFDDGSAVEGQLFASANSETASSVTMYEGAPPAPDIAVPGLCSPQLVTDASQTVSVTGPAGYGVRMIVAESGLYLSGVPGGGFDIEPFEHNTIIQVTHHSAVIGAGGTVNIPVTLTNSETEAGYNVISAVLVDAQGNEGATSQTLLFQLD
jgi:glucose/arabinose dehydrogenase